MCIFDLHDDLISDTHRYLPYQRLKDIVYLDIPNPNMPYLYNPLKSVSYEKRGLVASGILETFQKIFSPISPIYIDVSFCAIYSQSIFVALETVIVLVTYPEIVSNSCSLFSLPESL